MAYISGNINAEIVGGTAVLGGDIVDPKAMLELRSTTKGLLIPEMTTAERDILSPPILTYDELTISDGPISFWTHNDPTGVVAIDEIGLQDGEYISQNTTTLPILGQPSLLVSDPSTSALLDIAAKNMIGVPVKTEYSFTDGIVDLPFTFEVWVQLNSIVDDPPLMSKTGTPNAVENEWLFSVRDDGAVYCILYPQGRTDLGHHFWVTAPGVVSIGQVYHIGCTYSGVTSSGKIVINGVDTPVSYTSSGYTGMLATNKDVLIGAAFVATASEVYLDSGVQKSAIYNNELTLNQLLSHYNKGAGI